MLDDYQFAALAVGIMFLGGVVKGVVGLGLPLVGVGLMSMFVPVKIALGYAIMPVVLANIWQAHQAGGMAEPVRRFWPMLLVMWAGMAVGVHLLVTMDPQALYGAIGGVVIFVSALSLANLSPSISPAAERPVGLAVGSFAGVIGGISTMWGPPVSLYLIMLGLKKDAFIRTTGTLWFLGGVPVAILYAVNGILGWHNVWWSISLTVPAFLGMQVGKLLRNRIPQETFRKVLLVTLIVIGANLLRRGFQ